MPSTQETDPLDDLTIEQLQKLKLQEEIKNLRKPMWAQIPFISVITTLVIAFTGTTITIWQIQSKTEAVLAEQRQHFEDEVKKLEEDKKQAQEEKKQAQRLMDEALAKYQDARAEKAAVLSEKTEIANKANEMRELSLREKEEALRTRVTHLERFYEDLRNRDNGYISGFARGFIMENPTVQADITRFAKVGEKELMETWLKSQVLFTGIKQFQKYVQENTPPVNH